MVELVRQAAFREDGTQTDVPAKATERPQLEKQLNIFGWADGIEKLKKLKEQRRWQQEL